VVEGCRPRRGATRRAGVLIRGMSEHLLHAICDHYMLWLFTDATTGVCTLLYLKELWAEGRLIRWLMTGKAFNCAVSET